MSHQPEHSRQQGDESMRSRASGPRLAPQEHGGCPAEAGGAPWGDEAGVAGEEWGAGAHRMERRAAGRDDESEPCGEPSDSGTKAFQEQ